MEEITHVVLGHKPTRIYIGAGGLPCREYNAVNEPLVAHERRRDWGLIPRERVRPGRRHA
jgi:hypothetical protein